MKTFNTYKLRELRELINLTRTMGDDTEVVILLDEAGDITAPVTAAHIATTAKPNKIALACTVPADYTNYLLGRKLTKG